MADNYSSITITPYIPSELFTEELAEICDALQIQYDKFIDYGIYLYAENGMIDGALEDETPVDENHLIDALQKIITPGFPYVAIEECFSCSKMRQGEFGGTVTFITKDNVEYFSTTAWLRNKITQLTGQTEF